MARRGIRHRREEEEHPTVNLTPLVDVVFSILIMFIIVAPMLNLDRVELAESAEQAKSDGVSVRDGSSVTIHVHEDNTIWINQRLVDATHLPELLKQERQRHPDARPQLYHDRRAQFGTYQNVKNAVEAAGFDQLDIILKPA